MAAKPVASAAAVAEEEELVSVVWCTTLGIPEDVAIKLVNQKWRVAGLTKDESKFEKVLAGVGCLAGDIDAAWRKWQAASSRSPAQPSATFMAIPTLQRENERGFHFVNRDNELDTMEKWLTANGNDAHIEKSHSTPWHFVIAAQSLGTGKTALGAAFVDRMASANINICYIYINFERVIPSTPAPLATEESFKVFICTQVLGACISQLAPDGERDSKRAQWAGLSSSTPLLTIIAQFRPSASPLFVHFDEVDFLWEHKIKDRPLFYYLADYLCASLGGEHSLCYFSGRRTELFRVGRHMNGLAAHAATPYSSTQWHAEQLILSTLQPDHIRELLMRNKLTPSDQLVTQILAETGGVARLVGFALKHLLKDPTATVLIPAAFAQYVHEISSKDVQHALKPIFLRIAEWAIWGLPVRLDSPCDPAMLAKEKLGPMSVRELAEQFSLHTTKHEWFDDQVRIVVPLVLVRAAMIDLKGSIDSPVLSAVFLHYQASMGNVDDPATMILCRGGVSREQARETCGARVFLRLFFLAREDTALQHLCSVFASSYAGKLVVKRPLGQLCFMPKVVAGVKARAQMTEQQRKAATDRIARLMKKELSLLNADEAPAINFADWNHYLRPTPPLQGAFIAIDRSSSADVLILPHDTIQLQSGTEDPSGAGPLKCNTEFSCEIALQLKGNDDLTPLLIQQESAKIPAPTLDSKRILTLLIIGGGKLKDLAGVPVGSGEAIVAHYFGPRRPITTQADAYTIPAYMEVIVLTARGIACLFTHDLSTLLWPSLILSPDEIDPKVPTASGSAHTNAPAKRRQSAPAPTSLSPGPSDEGKRPAPKRGKGRGK